MAEPTTISGAQILAGLGLVAQLVSERMKQKVGEVNAPSNIADAISVPNSPKADEGRYSVAIVIDLQKAPAAGAFEWGSGIHSTKGRAGTYPITPRNAPMLAFFWERIDKFVVLPRVDHPGVSPRPYIKPTIEETLPQVKKILGRAFVVEVMRGQKRLEIIRA
jgi:hypothetical protein